MDVMQHCRPLSECVQQPRQPVEGWRKESYITKHVLADDQIEQITGRRGRNIRCGCGLSYGSVGALVPTQDAANKEPYFRSSETMPVILYFHGGGSVKLRPDVALYNQYCRRLAAHCHVVIVSVYYRQAPKDKFPTADDDSFTASEWLNFEAAKPLLPSNGDLSRTFLCGDTAHYVAVQAPEKDFGPTLKLWLVLIQPFPGRKRAPAEIRLKISPILTVDLPGWFWKAYFAHNANPDHPASLAFRPRAKELRNAAVPPALVIVGGQRHSAGLSCEFKYLSSSTHLDVLSFHCSFSWFGSLLLNLDHYNDSGLVLALAMITAS